MGSLVTALLMILFGVVTSDQAIASVDVATLLTLLGTMLISSFIRSRSRLFGHVGRFMSAGTNVSGRTVLVRTCAVSCVSAPYLSNDTACVALTPLVLSVCSDMRIPFQPMLIALATSANIGSAVTLVGNPQNILVGQLGGVEFFTFFMYMLLPVAAGLVINTLCLLGVYWQRLGKSEGSQKWRTRRTLAWLYKQSNRYRSTNDITNKPGTPYRSSTESTSAGDATEHTHTHTHTHSRDTHGNGESGRQHRVAGEEVGVRPVVDVSLDASAGTGMEIRSTSMAIAALESTSELLTTGNTTDIRSIENTRNHGNKREGPECDVDSSGITVSVGTYAAGTEEAYTSPTEMEMEAQAQRLQDEAEVEERETYELMNARLVCLVPLLGLSLKVRSWLWRVGVVSIIALTCVGFSVGGEVAFVMMAGGACLALVDWRDASALLESVDYTVLVFFVGVFITTEGLVLTGVPSWAWVQLEPYCDTSTAGGIATLTIVILFLSVCVSNVPTVIILGPSIAQSAVAREQDPLFGWLLLALVSTFAGNFIMVASMANLLVAEGARKQYSLSIWNHARHGVFSTVLVLVASVPILYGLMHI